MVYVKWDRIDIHQGPAVRLGEVVPPRQIVCLLECAVFSIDARVDLSITLTSEETAMLEQIMTRATTRAMGQVVQSFQTEEEGS